MHCIAHWESATSQYLVLGIMGENNGLDANNFIEEQFYCLSFQNKTDNESESVQFTANRNGCFFESDAQFKSSWNFSIIERGMFKTKVKFSFTSTYREKTSQNSDIFFLDRSL